MDALNGTIMQEPVRLPSSGKIVDLMTIKEIINKSPKDPFDNTPL